MNQHAAWRLALAQKIAPFYAIQPDVEAAWVFGSVARNFADCHSDIEIAVVWSHPPEAETLQTTAIEAGAMAWQMAPYNEANQSWSEQFQVAGVQIDTAHWTRATIENIVADVVERFDVSQNFLIFEKQATVSAIQNASVLHGHSLIEAWQKRVAIYPEALAIAMVQKHLRFGPFASREMLAKRNEIPLLYENHCHSVRLLLNLLFGLNRIYHPTFKWTPRLVEHMTIVPPHFFTRLERVFQVCSVEGTAELRSLIEETFDLIELHLPQIDLKPQRTEFTKPYPAWLAEGHA